MAKSESGRIVAIDIGDKWLGVAVSDPLRLIATPVTTIRCETVDDILTAVENIVREYQAGLLVAGFPRSLDGTIGQQAEKVQEIINKIADRLKIKIVAQDERYSTSRAKEILAGKKTKTKPTGVRDDAIAAALILNEYLLSCNVRTTAETEPFEKDT